MGPLDNSGNIYFCLCKGFESLFSSISVIYFAILDYL